MIPFIDPTLLPYVLSFLFTFAIVFALLSYSKILTRNANIAIATVFAIFAIAYEPFVTGMQLYMPIAAIVLIVLFFIKLLFDMLAPRDMLPTVVALAVLLLILSTLWKGISRYLPHDIDPVNVLWIVAIIIIILIFWAAYKHTAPKP